MEELTKAHKARIGIRTFKVIADAMTLSGYYKPSGKTGEKLAESLKMLSPEIYGSMSDPRVVELKGLEYVIDRMPRGIEKCTRMILTAQEDFHGTSFEAVIPLKRRRTSYIVSETEICFVITRGLTEIYDILTHITFLNIEAQKLYDKICYKGGDTSLEWNDLKKLVESEETLEGAALDQAIWNLSIILGRSYNETRESYESLEKNHVHGRYNNGLFNIIYSIGNRVINEMKSTDEQLAIYFTPSLVEMVGHHKYASSWAKSIKQLLCDLKLQKRPIHVISANLHSVINLLYGAEALADAGEDIPKDIYQMVVKLVNKAIDTEPYAKERGCYFHPDSSGSNIGVQIIDTSKLDATTMHPDITFDFDSIAEEKPVLIVMDYAFGTQAFEVLDELLGPYDRDKKTLTFSIESISIMGKAGILPGKKGDIMLATAHVMEGTAHNYIVQNDLSVDDFDKNVDVYTGPMVTVLGTSLQNKDVIERFHLSSWKAVGLEMEGGHYQRAINAAIIQGHIPSDMKTRYAYYASDNPLISGQTLASGAMGQEGILPTYMITHVLLKKILKKDEKRKNE